MEHPMPSQPKEPSQLTFRHLSEGEQAFAIEHYPGAGPNDRRLYQKTHSQSSNGVKRMAPRELQTAARLLENHLGADARAVFGTCPINPKDGRTEVLIVVNPKPGAEIPTAWSGYPVDIEHDPDE
jgi:hypothetical protein